MSMVLLLAHLIVISCQDNEPVTVMYRKRMQHIAEMNYVGILSINHILDVGASDGYWTDFASKLFPTSKFFMIEGNPYLHQTLTKTGHGFAISVVGADHAKDQAISFVVKKQQSQTTFPSEEQATADTVESKDVTAITEELRASQARVTTTTIDDIVTERGLAPSQLIRFNLRGQEFAALQGANKTLHTAEFVLIEVPLHQYHPGAASLADLNSFLSLRGFRIYDILDLRYSQPRTDLDVFYQVPTLVQFDVLWAREDSRVFSGANYPPPPPPKYLLDHSQLRPPDEDPEGGQGQEQGQGQRQREFVVTAYRGGLAAVPLTSTTLGSAATADEIKSQSGAAEVMTPSTPPSPRGPSPAKTTYRRRRRKTSSNS